MEMKVIAHIHTDFPTKFGVPRQSGLVGELSGKIVFVPEYRNPDALRGIEGFSHIWLIWMFSECVRNSWMPTVRPPRLGGNTHIGVFATRSPFRPNPIGLSCVELERVCNDDKLGTVLYVRGADLVDNTPIFDIKPYLPYADCRPQATGGFAQPMSDYRLEVDFPKQLKQCLPEEKVAAVCEVLGCDPRPGYHDDPERIYGFVMSGFEIKFKVCGNKLRVVDVSDAK